MISYALFTDVSVNPQKRLGVGACLLLPLQLLDAGEIDRPGLAGSCFYKRFTDTSSTLLELQTVLWGLELYRQKIPAAVRGGLMLYTDSQCIAELPRRRERLEESAYCSRASGRLLVNALLYQQIYAASDELGFLVTKVAGHSRSATHDNLQQLFSVVDRGARRELKLWLSGSPLPNY